MAAIMQMGHDTENLVGEEELGGLRQLVLSPLNRTPRQLVDDVTRFKDLGCSEILLDPQLYYPRTPKEKLRSHPYFPKDIQTADLGNFAWWKDVNKKIARYGADLKADTIISPAVQPKAWKDDYYASMVAVANDLTGRIAKTSKCLVCLPIHTSQLDDPSSAPRIASIVSQTTASGFYVVFVSDQEPRREMSEDRELLGMMTLIHDLKRTSMRVVVAFASSEMPLLKCAGADDVGTGKFFNLRRYSPGRYEEPPGGGGQVEYWFSQGLMAFLRTRDVLQLQAVGNSAMLIDGYSDGVWAKKILDQLAVDENKAWLALSWRHYLSWFWRIEEKLSGPDAAMQTSEILKSAEANWRKVEDADILLDEPRNDGTWIRPWRQALSAFQRQFGGSR